MRTSSPSLKRSPAPTCARCERHHLGRPRRGGSHGPTHYRSELRITPAGDGTALTMTFGGQPSGLGGRVAAATLGRLFARPTRKALAADLDDIAQTSERSR
jgi:hypothetical protein